MKVILKKDFEELGHEGQVVEVSEGYARNFLYPRNMAVKADAAAIKELEKNHARIEKKLEARKEGLKETAKKLASIALQIQADAGEGGKLFGSVTGADVAEAIKKAHGIEVDKRKILLDDHIKTIGEHRAKVKMMQGIEAEITINVIAAEK